MTIGKSVTRTNDRKKDKILGNAMEALIGAIFLDAGFKIAKELILKVWRRQIDVVRNIEVHAKTALQEYLQSRGKSLPNINRYLELAQIMTQIFC